MGAKRRVDRAVVLDYAAALADVEGLEQLSLARVAEHVGLKIPSLYNHIDGMPGLRRELALRGGRGMLEALRGAAVGRAGDDAVKAMAEAYRAYAREHPGLYAAAQRAPAHDDTEHTALAAQTLDLLRTVLAGYGLQDDDATHAIRALRSVLHGFVALEADGGFGMPLERDESFRRLVDLFIAGVRSKQTH